MPAADIRCFGPVESALRREVVRELRQRLAAGLGHEHEVLEAAAAVARAVQARLDREHVAGDELVVAASCRASAARAPRARRRGRASGRSRPRATRPRPSCAASDSPRPRRCRRRRRRPTCRSRRGGSRRARARASRARGGATRRPRPATSPTTKVRVMSAQHADASSLGQMSITIGSPARSAPEPRLWPIADCGPCETMKSSQRHAALHEDGADRALDALARQRLPVELQHAVGVRARGEDHVARGAHRPVGRGLGAPDALELGAGLGTAAAVEHLAVRASPRHRRRAAGRPASPGSSPGRWRCSRRARAPHAARSRRGSPPTRCRCAAARRSRTPPAGGTRSRSGPAAPGSPSS